MPGIFNKLEPVNRGHVEEGGKGNSAILDGVPVAVNDGTDFARLGAASDWLGDNWRGSETSTPSKKANLPSSAHVRGLGIILFVFLV